MIEPRKTDKRWEATLYNYRKPKRKRRSGWAWKSHGVGEQDMYAGGPPGTWEALSSPPTINPVREAVRLPISQAAAPVSGAESERISGTRDGTAERRKRSEAGRATGSRRIS